jgi:hypothetical protein
MDKAKITQYVHPGEPSLPNASPAVDAEQVVVLAKNTAKAGAKGLSKAGAKPGRKGKTLATA